MINTDKIHEEIEEYSDLTYGTEFHLIAIRYNYSKCFRKSVYWRKAIHIKPRDFWLILVSHAWLKTSREIDLFFLRNFLITKHHFWFTKNFRSHTLYFTNFNIEMLRKSHFPLAGRQKSSKFYIKFSANSFLTRESRACARASCRYDLDNSTRSLARLIDSCKLFFSFRLLSAFDSFWRVINKRNGDLCC